MFGKQNYFCYILPCNVVLNLFIMFLLRPETLRQSTEIDVIQDSGCDVIRVIQEQDRTGGRGAEICHQSLDYAGWLSTRTCSRRVRGDDSTELTLL